MKDDPKQLTLDLGGASPEPPEGDAQSSSSQEDAAPAAPRRWRRRERTKVEKPAPVRRPRARAAGPAPADGGYMPADIRALLGPPALPRWERLEDFERLRSALAAQFNPEGLIDWIIIDDVAYSIMGATRIRRAQAAGLALAQKDATTKLLLANSRWEPGTSAYPGHGMIEIAAEFVAGDKDAKKVIAIIMDELGLAPDAVGSTCVLINLDHYDQLDAMIERHNRRRDTGFTELSRRKASRLAAGSPADGEILDADFE